jgi:hypothetical protein
MILPGVLSDDDSLNDDLTDADSATTPPTDCAKERRFIVSPPEFERLSTGTRGAPHLQASC